MTNIDCKILFETISLRFKQFGTPGKVSRPMLFDRVFRRKYSSVTDFWLFENISLEIKTGERVGIVGRNGAGKSTLLKLMAGVYAPTKGRIHVSGRMSPLIGPGAGMQPQLSGSENIILMGTIMGIPVNEMKKRLHVILEFADLMKFADMPVKYYSKGMVQRLAFSAATEIAPDILLSDEVFSGGDAEFQNRAQKRIMNFIDRSKIFIFVSHNLNLLRKITGRAIWIEKGKIFAQGPTDDVCKEYEKYIQNLK